MVTMSCWIHSLLRMVRKVNSQSLGVLLALLSAVAFGTMAALLSSTASEIPTSQMAFAFGLVGVVIFAPNVFKNPRELFSAGCAVLWVRAIAGALSLNSYYWNLGRIPSGDALAMFNLSPLFVALISSVWFRDRLPLSEWFGIIGIVLGLLALRSPSGSAVPGLSLLIGIFGALMGAVAYLALAVALRTKSMGIVIWAFCLASSLLPLALFSKSWVLPGLNQVYIILLCSALGLLGQWLVSLAFKKIKPAIGAALSLSSLLWAVSIQALISRSYPSFLTLCGYALILFGVYLIQTRPIPTRKQVRCGN